jgi:uncharacterized repeat protein (TIGR01451 family)
MRNLTLPVCLALMTISQGVAMAEGHTEVPGRPSDHDLSTPFSVSHQIYGFPDIPMPGILSFTFDVPSVQNNTTSPIQLQVYVSRGFDQTDNSLLSSSQMPIAGCTVTLAALTAADLSATCLVSAADNQTLLAKGIINNLFPSQSLALGFAASGPPDSLTFSSDGNNDTVNWTITPGPPSGLAFVAGSAVVTQAYPISGFDDGIVVSTAVVSGGNWLSAVAASSTGPTTVSVSVTPSGSMAPAIYAGTVTISDSDNNSLAVPVVLTVLPSSAQYIQQGGKLTATGMYQGSSVALSQDGSIALVGATEEAEGTSFGSASTYNRSGVFWNFNPNLPTQFSSVGEAEQGRSVSLSADGSVFLSGGPDDDNAIGAAWVYGGPCAPAKLVGTNAVGNSQQGFGAALSADGLTALVGGLGDNSRIGALWVFVCSQGAWTQQGPKLTASNESSLGAMGLSVAISADGNTALSGGDGDNGGTGAAWVFVRNGTTWTQQAKLTGVTSGFVVQGESVALSADGNTAVVGSPYDASSYMGAAWVFTRSGTTWSSGVKLVGTGAVGSPVHQGGSVAISPDGAAIAVGGYGDNGNTGAVWIFKKSGNSWTQFGTKLTGSDAVGAAYQGNVALSQFGNTLLFGGDGDNSNIGAAWAFVLSGPAPVLVGLNPTQADVGASGFTLTVNGSNFLQGATVQWNGAPLPTSFVSTSQVTAAVSANLVATAGAIPVTAVNPDGTPAAAATFTVIAPVLSVVKKHTGNFAQGEPAATYTVTVSNTAGAAPTSGPVTVTETVPAGMTLVSMTGGQEWTCPSGGAVCTTSKALTGGAKFSDITVKVQVTANANATLVNQVAVAGGASAPANASDSTTVVTPGACDVYPDTQVNLTDVQQTVNEALGTAMAANDVNGDGRVNVADVEVVLKATLSGVCTPH